MATIKFISEYKCLLYIDMTFIDVLEPNKLKIIELLTGSYLIEIKNNANVSIKSYILNVSVGVTQMVQQVFTEKESIEDVLNNLKNDYLIRFHNQRLRFKHNNKYGYVNSRFEVVINPQYIEAEEFIMNKALVKKSFGCIDKVTILYLKHISRCRRTLVWRSRCAPYH
ncbi:MAG: WG repeat-containing protein [Muribaculaceae bacterium]|nr:WG repeat-containing protein [Muribaculaceae bacterium]